MRPAFRTARPSSLPGTLQALIPPAAFALLGWQLWGGLIDGAILGAIAWFLLRLVLVRWGLARQHYAGMAAARRGDWAPALSAFQASQARWDRLPWLDRLRGPLLGSASRLPYRVMALYNQAVCLFFLDRPEEAWTALERLEQSGGLPPEARELRGHLALGRGAAGHPDAAGPLEAAGFADLDP